MKKIYSYFGVILFIFFISGCEMAGGYLDGIGDKISADQDSSIPEAGIYDHGVILSITSAGPDYVTLTWTEPSDAEYNHVEISWVSGPEEPGIVYKGNNTFNILTPGVDTIYEINALAVSDNGDRSAANIISIRIPSYQRDVNCIYTVEDLAAIDTNSSTMSAFYILRNDLSLSSYSTGIGWPALGTNSSSSFSGIFDGNGHTISNLYINMPSDSDKGFFSNVQGGIIENLSLQNVDVSGLNNTGALAGRTGAGTIIRNCNVSGSITGSSQTGALVGYFSESLIYGSNSSVIVNGEMNTGAFFGEAQGGSATDCNASGIVNGTSQVGGFTGFLNGFDVNNSTASVTVTGTGGQIGGFAGVMTGGTILDSTSNGNVQGVSSVGGFIGDVNQGTISLSSASGNVNNSNIYTGGFAGTVYDTDIVECRATGNVIAANGAGGFIGNHDDTSTGIGSVIRSYATGSVSGADSVGGFVGDSNVTEYSDCYAMGDVSGVNNVGGFVGSDNASDFVRLYSIGFVSSGGASVGGLHGSYVGTYTDCYYDTISGYSNGSAGVIPLSDIDMKNSANYLNWDFSTIWDVSTSINGGYPHLRALVP